MISKRELVDEEMVAGEQSILHTSGWNLDGFRQEGSHKKNDNHCEKEGIEILT
jgi:hypothetical protein